MICMVMLLLSTATAVLAEGGALNVADNTEGRDGWTEISDYEDLQSIPDDSDGNYYLTGNIDCSGETDFEPIENFSGTFDGNGYVIQNLTVNVTETDVNAYAGLFATTDEGAVIMNLGLVDSSISAETTATGGNIYAYAGGLIGLANSTTITITNSYNTGDVKAEAKTIGGDVVAYAGGLIGLANSTTITITDSYNTGSVMADAANERVYALAYAGGLIGYANSTTITITNSYNTGSVTADAIGVSIFTYAGGLIGYASASATITNSHNTGSVMADVYTAGENAVVYAYAGGLIGYAINATIEITNSYNTGSVTADAIGVSVFTYAGGLIGYASISATITIASSYNTRNVMADADATGGRIYAYAGGLIGYAINATIINSYNTGNVKADASAIGGEAYAYVGGLVGYAYRDATITITSSYNTGNVTADASAIGGSARAYTGGLVSYADYDATITITNSYNTGNVTADVIGVNVFTYAGGLIGQADRDETITITSSYNTGNVTADATGEYAIVFAGGLIGYANSDTTITITNSYNTRDVMADATGGDVHALSYAYAGGLIGNAGYREIIIASSYNTGDVTAEVTGEDAYAGGLIGYADGSVNIIHSYYLKGISEGIVGNMDDSEVTSDTDSGSREKKDMKTGDPGRDDIYVDWDFNNIWKLDTDGMVNEGYPYHKANVATCEVVITSQGNGTTDPSGTLTVEYGYRMTIRFTPGEGNELSEVRVNGSVVNVSGNTLSITITSDTVVDVLFSSSSLPPSEQTFYLYVYGEEGGYAYGTGYYISGTAVTITAEPMQGYEFERWSDGSDEKTRTIVVVSDMTLSAYFSKEGSSSIGSGEMVISWNVVLITIVIILVIAVAAISYGVLRGRRSLS